MPAKTWLQQLEALVGLAKKKSEERGVMDHPKQILHGDWHPKNLRMHPDGRVSGILDFDAVRVDAVAHELANAVLQVSLRRPKDLALSQWPSGLHFQSRATAHVGVAITHRKGTSRWHLEHVALVDDRRPLPWKPCCPLRYGEDARASMFKNGSKPEPKPQSGYERSRSLALASR